MGAAPVLTVLKDGQTIKSQPLEGEVLLGRGEGCVIRLDDRAISRQHAVFRPVSGGVQVEKKSEVAPLSVNGTECTTAVVKEGDVIAIGPYLLKLSTAGAMAAEVISTPVITAPVDAEKLPEIGQVDAGELAPLSLDPPAPGSEQAPAPDALDGSQALSLQMDGGSSEISSQAPENTGTPEFSLGQQAPESAGPVDIGSISIDEDGQTKISTAGKVSAKLVLPPGAANVSELEITKDEISIGRGKDCDIVLDDKKASRKHAVLRRAGVNFSIKDLGSANGTYVNGSKVDEQELSGDDILKIGNVEFRFLVLSSEYVANQDKFIAVPQPEPSQASIGYSQAAMPAPEYMPPAAQNFAAGLTPSAEAGGAAIPGLAGIGGVTHQKKSLIEKFKDQPRPRQILILLVLGLFLWWVLEDEAPQPPSKKPAVVQKEKDPKEKAPATFESLTPEQKKFVETQHALAFDYYKNRDYDKALFEIQKIFALIPDYKDSREIERYAKEGKKKIEAQEEEKRRKEEEEKLKLKIAELVDQAKDMMEKKKFDKAKELFPQILALDPDNQQVAEWRRSLDKMDEEKRIKDQEKSVQEQINVRAWDLYKEGMALKAKGKYHEAIDTFKRVMEVGASDRKVEKSARARIRDTENLITQLRDPVLADAKAAEDAQDLPKAYSLYEKATQIDPPHPAGYAGMARIRDVLHERAKALYIEAVLAESYSDFETAKKKFQECKDVAPKDDVYYERAERKLALFFKPKEEQPQ